MFDFTANCLSLGLLVVGFFVYACVLSFEFQCSSISLQEHESRPFFQSVFVSDTVVIKV